MRTLGLDYGQRRIGVAISDQGGRLATPVEVMEVSRPETAIGPLAALVRREGIERLMVGLPLNMDGSEGPAAGKVRRWARLLEEATGLEVVLVDERLSSFEAEQELVERKRAGERLTRAGKKRRLDAVAAARLLQAYLDGRLEKLPEAAPGKDAAPRKGG